MKHLLVVALLALATLAVAPAEATPVCVTSPVGVIVLGDVLISPNQHLAGCAGGNSLIVCGHTIGYLRILDSYEAICLP